MRLAGCAWSRTMAAAALVRRGRAWLVRTRPRCSIRSWSGIGAEWPVTAWGSRNRLVILLAMHHWRKGRTALRWFSLLSACQASMSAWQHPGRVSHRAESHWRNSVARRTWPTA